MSEPSWMNGPPADRECYICGVREHDWEVKSWNEWGDAHVECEFDIEKEESA